MKRHQKRLSSFPKKDNLPLYLTKPSKKPLLVATAYLESRQGTTWNVMVNYHDQFIAVGARNNELH